MILFPQFPQNDEIYKKYFLQSFLIILKEPLLVQKQTIAQMKALILSFLEPEGPGRGNVKRAPRLLAAKSIFCTYSSYYTYCLGNFPQISNILTVRSQNIQIY